MRITRVIFGFVVSLSLYCTQLTVISTNQFIFKKEMTSLCYLIPIIIPTIFILILFCSFKISEQFYCNIYTLFGLYMGYSLYAFQTGLLIRFINIFFPLTISLNFFLLYIVPFIICIYGVFNALKTRVENINLKYPGFKGNIKILLLSDIHLGAIHQKNSVIRIVQETKLLNPDIVVITGDMADGSLKVKPEWLMPFNELTIPVLFVTGNHEELNPKVDMIKAVNMTKIKHIGENEIFKFKGVNFIGEDFGLNLRKNLLNIKQEENTPNILLSHIPILKPNELAKYNIFLFLTGHTHGGQLFPLHVVVYFANACFSGLYSDKNKKHFIYVTDGVNNALCPMRVGSRRMFPIITIEGE
jgi:predicted MPP superfamily phosphohydrolase